MAETREAFLSVEQLRILDSFQKELFTFLQVFLIACQKNSMEGLILACQEVCQSFQVPVFFKDLNQLEALISL